MTRSPDRLYELLPAIYRQRDAERDYPLQALLRVIAEQVNVVEDDIARLYENWFIETCDDWVVPYIGDLVGYETVHEAGEPGNDTAVRERLRNKILISRREAANTIGYRRRKGTLALLEELANAAAGWPARAVEFYKLLAWTQHLDHLRLQRGRTADLRDGDALDVLNGPFDKTAHTAELRRIVSHRSQGRFNILSVGVYVWRLKPYSVTRTPAYSMEEGGCYSFSILGNDTPLYNRPQPESDPTHIAEEPNLPVPIRRRAFEERVMDGPHIQSTKASDVYYGVDKSVTIWAPGWPTPDAVQPIPRESIIPANLSDWKYRAPRDRVLVDPELGRIIFPSSQRPAHVRVSYQYAFSADIGGGEYERTFTQPPTYKLYRVGEHGDYVSLKAALDAWNNDQPDSAVIEITDSGVYTEKINVALKKSAYLQIRAANRTRPILRLLDYVPDSSDAFSISGDAGSRLTLDGLLITGRGVRISGRAQGPDEAGGAPGDLCDVAIRHCTLVPGWEIQGDCKPTRPAEPSLEVVNTRATIRIEHSIIGSIFVTADETAAEPVPIAIKDSILDATGADCERPECEAVGAPDLPVGYAELMIVRSTVIGRVNAHAIRLAENSIFTGKITVARRQLGCMRFCYAPPGSRTPRRYNCQPDLVVQALEAQSSTEGQVQTGAALDAAKERERMRVKPQFNSLRYGTPTYCQLADACADEIKRGAEDESEMGAFHDLYQPQREVNLRARLDEYTPAGMEAGIIFAS